MNLLKNKPQFILILLFGFNSFGQKADTSAFNSFINITFGNKYISKSSNNQGANIDYFDYLYVSENHQLGLQIRKSLNKNNAITATISTYSDLVPRNIEVFYSKLKGKYFGYFAGAKTYAYYFSEFPLINTKGEFANYTDPNLNLNYRYINQASVFAGPLFYFKNKRFTIETKLNLGVGVIGKFNQSGYLNSTNSFEKLKVEIKSSASPYFLIVPDFNLSYFPIISRKFKIGITGYGNYMNINRSFDYKRTIYQWTTDNFKTKNIKGNINHFNNIEVNFGLVCHIF